MIYLQLFIVFFKIGMVSFGGGMAMLPLIDREATKHGWITPEQFLDIVAVGGMAPGPVATNTAILIGYEAAGAPGSLAATLGMMLPSLLIILLVSLFFFRVKESQLVQSAFYALRPVITGLIIYAAITFALRNEMISAEK